MSKRNNRKWAPVWVAALLGLALAAPAGAATIGFNPSSVLPAPGDNFTVDVVVSDLGGEVVSAYDLDITFDDSLLNVNFVSFSSALGDLGAFEALADADLSPGVLDVASLSLLSDADLLALQGGDTITLFTIGMTSDVQGVSELNFVFDEFNDVKGLRNQVLDLRVRPGTVGEVIPEPTAALVFAVGALLVGAAAGRRRA